MNEDKYIQLFEDGELFSYIDDLQKRIDKAIEYIKSFEYYIPDDDVPKLLEILKGSDKE